jgi:hypothetical protein
MSEAAKPVVDARAMQVVYANYCRINATPEEVILDFGLNSRVQTDNGPEPVQLTHRLVLSWPTIERTAATLADVVRVHQTHPSHRGRAGSNSPPETPS